MFGAWETISVFDKKNISEDVAIQISEVEQSKTFSL